MQQCDIERTTEVIKVLNPHIQSITVEDVIYINENYSPQTGHT